MLDFLDAAARDPGRYGVHPKHHSLLKAAVHVLKDLKSKDLDEGNVSVRNQTFGEKGDSEDERNHVYTPNGKVLDPKPFNWEGVDLPCCSQYDLLKLVLSILGRAPQGANRRNHHLALLIVCAKFLILAAGEKPKRDAPGLVSITFVDEDDSKSPIELTERLEESHGLNVLLGATIPMHKTFKNQIREKRYDFLDEEGNFCLPGRQGRWWFDGKRTKWPCGQCAETFALVLLQRYIPSFLPLLRVEC